MFILKCLQIYLRLQLQKLMNLAEVKQSYQDALCQNPVQSWSSCYPATDISGVNQAIGNWMSFLVSVADLTYHFTH